MAITTNGKVSITNLQVGSSADLAGVISDESGTGVLAFTNTPTFTTPVLGAATATSVNKVTLTAPATTATLTLAEGSSLITSGAHATTITTTGTTAITLPVTGTLATQADVAAGQVGGVTETGTQTLTNKTISASNNTLTGVATETGTQTLTNKTLTSPVLGGTTTTASGNLVLDPATKIVEVKGDGASVVGQIQLNCHVNTHGQLIASQPHSEAATNKLTLPGGTTIGNSDAVLVSDIGTQTLTNKTLTSPTVNTATIAGGTLSDAVIRGLEEDVNVVASAATGTIDFNIETASIWYYTSNASANFTLNFRFSSGVSLDTALATGDAITLVFLNTNGATPYYPNVIQIDGSAVTPKVPAAISAGNASAIDAYSFTIIKTASATFTVLETQTKFA